MGMIVSDAFENSGKSQVEFVYNSWCKRNGYIVQAGKRSKPEHSWKAIIDFRAKAAPQPKGKPSSTRKGNVSKAVGALNVAQLSGAKPEASRPSSPVRGRRQAVWKRSVHATPP